jgi:hypothetical protein
MLYGCYFLPVRSTSSGEARHTDEYVPTRVPNMRARAKPLRLSGHHTKSAISTIITVDDTKSERRIVSHMDMSMIAENEDFLDAL